MTKCNEPCLVVIYKRMRRLVDAPLLVCLHVGMCVCMQQPRVYAIYLQGYQAAKYIKI